MGGRGGGRERRAPALWRRANTRLPSFFFPWKKGRKENVFCTNVQCPMDGMHHPVRAGGDPKRREPHEGTEDGPSGTRGSVGVPSTRVEGTRRLSEQCFATGSCQLRLAKGARLALSEAGGRPRFFGVNDGAGWPEVGERWECECVRYVTFTPPRGRARTGTPGRACRPGSRSPSSRHRPWACSGAARACRCARTRPSDP